MPFSSRVPRFGFLVLWWPRSHLVSASDGCLRRVGRPGHRLRHRQTGSTTDDVPPPRRTSSVVLPAISMIADGAHLLILMWLHLDHSYFLAGYAKAILGALSLFGVLWEGSYPLQMAASGVIR